MRTRAFKLTVGNLYVFTELEYFKSNGVLVICGASLDWSSVERIGLSVVQRRDMVLSSVLKEGVQACVSAAHTSEVFNNN